MNRYLFAFACCIIAYTTRAQVDTIHGFTAPAEVTKDHQRLTAYLCADADGDIAKANLIFNWITHNISYDIKETRNPNRKPTEIKKVLSERKATPEGYTLLYTEMCREAGLKAVSINGYLKDWKYDDSNLFYMPRYEWCGVLLNGRWELVDVIAGTGHITHSPGWWRRQLNKVSKEKVLYANKAEFEMYYDPSRFMIDPLLMRFNALPADPVWQLTTAQMPLNIFQAGKQEILKYNAINSKRVEKPTYLLKISGMTEREKMMDAADRMHAFNERYPYALYVKTKLQATYSTTAYIKTGKALTTGDKAALANAKDSLKKALIYLQQQKALISVQYTKLNKNNSVKNKSAKEHIRTLRQGNNLFTTQINSRIEGDEKKKILVADKNRDIDNARRYISIDNMRQVEAAKIQKDPTSPMMVKIMDSVNAKSKRLLKYDLQKEELLDKLSEIKSRMNQGIESLSTYLRISDSLLMEERYARMYLSDNHDDDLKQILGTFAYARFEKTDVLSKQYFADHDSMIVHFENLRKVYHQKMDLYKGILKDVEQYRKWSSDNPELMQQYAAVVTEYDRYVNEYISLTDEYYAMLDVNMLLFKEMKDFTERQMERLDDIEKYEADRMRFEETELAEEKAFEEEDLKAQQLYITTMTKEIDNAIK